MGEFNFEPIIVNSTAPGGACTLRTFDVIGTFILNRVNVPRRLSGHWQAVRQDLPQARDFAKQLPCFVGFLSPSFRGVFGTPKNGHRVFRAETLACAPAGSHPKARASKTVRSGPPGRTRAAATAR